MGRGLIGTLLAATLMVPGVARADWREAVSNNFIVVSDESEKVVRQRVEGLERFGLILQALTGARRLKTPPVKIKVFFVKDIPDVQNTMPYPSEGIAGYYSASIRGPFAVMPRLDNGRFLWSTSAKVIMQHELTHHFTFQYFPAAYPSWYSEGFADYAGAITVSEDGVAMIGLTREDRIQMIQFSNWIPVSKLLTMKSYADAHGNIGALYGEGWLLVHFLNSTPEGKAALNKYLVAINAGQSYTDAAAAFGDLSVLDRKLKTYGSRLSLHATETHYTNIDIGPVSVRTLAPDEAALVSADISLSSGIAAARMPDFVRDVRQTAARFPTSPSALHILTETERRAGNAKQASVAADQWLAAAPQDPLAMLNRAQLDIEALKASKSTDAAAWNAARKRILAANKLAPNDPQILKGYYDSYVSQGQLPPAPAQNALAGALENLPQDDDLRYEVASDYEARGMIDDAIFVIRPAAYQAHGDTDLTPKEKAKRDEIKRRYPIAGDTEPAESPMEMLNRLEKKKAETTKANPG